MVLVALLVVVAGWKVFGGYGGFGGGIHGQGHENGDSWFSAGREDVLVRMEGKGATRDQPVVLDDYTFASDYDYDGDDRDADNIDGFRGDGEGLDGEETAGDVGNEGRSGDGGSGKTRAVPQRTPPPRLSAPPPPPPPPPRQKHNRPACKIHILDPTASVCNITDVWPYDHPGRGMVGMSRTPHHHAPHAAGYWLTSAVRSNPQYYTSDLDKADLVLVDTHCFESQYAAVVGGGAGDGPPLVVISEREKERVSMEISRVFVDEVTNTNAYVKSKGKKFVVVRPTLGAPPGSMLDSCAKLKSVFFVGSERGVFCDNDRNRAWKGQSVLLPPVSVGYELELAGKHEDEPTSFRDRDVMFYLRLPCYRHLPRSPNTIFLESVEQRLQKSWDVLQESFNTSDSSRVIIDMSDEGRCDGGAVDHAVGVEARKRSLEIMGRSRYCAIFAPGDRQSSVELGLAIRRGCIPVFLGPPFHAMPMASNKIFASGTGDDIIGIEYSKFAVFVHVADHTKSMWAFDDVSLSDSDLEPDTEILNSPVEVPDAIDAIRYLQNVPWELANGLHAEVLSVRDMFAYGADKDGPRSAVDVALDSMCAYWSNMKMEEARKKQEREKKAEQEREEKSRQDKQQSESAVSRPTKPPPRSSNPSKP